MSGFITQMQGNSGANTLYNLKGTGFVVVSNVASGTDENTYTIPSGESSITFKITSAQLGNAVSKGLCFILDTTLAITVTDNIKSLLGSHEPKSISLNSSPTVNLYGASGAQAARMNVNTKYLVYYDGSVYRVLNEAIMGDADDVTSNNSTTKAVAPTIEYMQTYVSSQLNNRWNYVICPATATSIPAGAIYKASSSAAQITGKMAASASTEYKIYMVLHNIHSDSVDIYDEWITVKNGSAYSWEKIGNTDVNLAFTLETTSNGTHHHTIASSGSHTHTTASDGAHTHTITIPDTLEFVHNASTPVPLDGSGNVSIVTGTSSQSQTTSSAGGHAHTLQNIGNHTHTTSTDGSHTHTLNSSGSHTHDVAVDFGAIPIIGSKDGGSTWDLDMSEQSDIQAVTGYTDANVATNDNGDHSHTLENKGNHTHTMNSAGGHGHTLQKTGDHTHTVSVASGSIPIMGSTDGTTFDIDFGTNNTYMFLKSITSGNKETNSNGDHSHTLQNTGAHTHTMNTTGAHAHTMNNSGDHSHTLQNTGAHTHSVAVGAGAIPIMGSSDEGTTWDLDMATQTTFLAVTDVTDTNVATTDNGNHTHTMNSVADHSHTLQNTGGHTHSIDDATFTVSNEILTLRHNHTEQSAGAHAHTMNSTGGHSHTLQTTGSHKHTVSNVVTSVNTKRMRLKVGEASLTAASAGSHTHTMNTTGAHKHTLESTGGHAHTLENAGNHVHTMNSTGAHTHTVNGVVTSATAEKLKIKVGDASLTAASAGSHTHTMNSVADHSHTLESTGAHTHTMNTTGSHKHTVSGVVTEITTQKLRLKVGEASLTAASAGSHTHTAETVAGHSHTTNSKGAHTHTMNTNGAHTHTVTDTYPTTEKLILKLKNVVDVNSSSNGGHTHSISSSGAHTHTTTDNGAHTHTVTHS